MTIVLRDPTGETASTLRERTSPLDGFEGKTVALMDIGKMRGDEFIDRLEHLCSMQGINTRRYKKPTNTRVAPRGPSLPIHISRHHRRLALTWRRKGYIPHNHTR